MLHALGRWTRRFTQYSLAFVIVFLAVMLPIGEPTRRTLIRTCRQLGNMDRTIRISGRTIRVSEEFYERVKARQEDGESLEKAVRREAGGPHPSEVAGLLTPEEAERMKEAAKRFREDNGEWKRRARGLLG